MNCPSKTRTAGFTIIELLIVMGVIGVVITAVFGLYISTRSSAHTQEEVVEVQQSLRIAADQIARDVRLAGFMNPAGMSPVSAATATAVSVRTSAQTGQMARIAAPFLSPSSSNATIDAIVASEDMADFFAEGVWVRIIRPPNKTEPLNDTFKVVGVDRNVPSVTLTDFMTSGEQYNPGDIMVRVEDEGTTLPVTVSYGLNGTGLERNGEILAEGITGLAFSYVLPDGETESPVAGDLQSIRAVRFTITGLSRDKGQGQKERTVSQLATIRN
jgi:prepilin-type N-terminal cleavage/methylation domain-containing protein